MNHKDDEKHILHITQKLFPRQNFTDAVEIFLILGVKSHSKGENWVSLGGIKEIDNIVIQPTGQVKHYVGKSISGQITNFINEEYWLITLWDILYEDSKYSTIAKEILRGFIKHCVSEISKNLVYYGPKTIETKHIDKNHLPNHIKFYKSVFSYKLIKKEMRKPALDRIKNKHKIHKSLNQSDLNINTDDLLNLFEEFNQDKYYNLINTIRNEKEPEDLRYAINTIAGIYSFMSMFMHKKSNINKALMGLLEGS